MGLGRFVKVVWDDLVVLIWLIWVCRWDGDCLDVIVALVCFRTLFYTMA